MGSDFRPSFVFLVLLVCFSVSAQNKPSLDYYLAPAREGGEIRYRPDVPPPADFLGFELGEWHVSHDLLVSYLKLLAEKAPERIHFQEYGRTYEKRPLICLTITSPENHRQRENIKRLRRRLANPAQSTEIAPASLPAVIYMGYSIHGNEASGSNAALAVAYHLAAAEGKTIDSLLQSTVILLDPCFNPDGLQRFSSWVNSRRSSNGSTAPESDEFNEPWPGGRTNHYWFDLNRDWLVAQQPETGGRLAIFHAWKPNILTDHHEMGSNSTFFFQPGVPSRVNPLTPAKNQELTARIARFHANLLSRHHISFYTGENYDDFYYGKGSTYPDVNGAVGILFEQASSRGSAQQTVNGLLTFPYTIRNQVFTSLSSLQAACSLRVELNTYLRDFYREGLQMAQKDPFQAFMVTDWAPDLALNRFGQMLDRHGIQYYFLQQKVSLNGYDYPAGTARTLVIPTDQPQYRLVRSLFDRSTKFQDSIFYDISAWTMPDAFGLQWTAVKREEWQNSWINTAQQASATEIQLPAPALSKSGPLPFAYVLNARYEQLHNYISRLQQKGIQLKLSMQPFSTEGRVYPAGSVIIPTGENAAKLGQEMLREILNNINLPLEKITNGLTEDGPDLGSSSFVRLPVPKVLLVTGTGMSVSEAGEIWHFLDQHCGLSVTQVDNTRLQDVTLMEYNVLILPGNIAHGLTAARLGEFAAFGGTIIALGNALKGLQRLSLAPVEFREVGGSSRERRPYGRLKDDRGSTDLPGVILEALLDRTHPLCFGYERDRLPLFLSDTLFIKPSKNPYANPVVFTEQPLLAGYVHARQRPPMSGAAAIVVTELGRGRIIGFAVNPAFRGFWYGSHRLLANAVYWGSLISREAAERK